ncbi:MAG: transposase [Gammaproteobacteria bacterium]|nr:transposase [Gammaproteobacteria bacterium]
MATFVEDLRAHGGTPEQVEAVSIDMSKAYIAGVARHLPEASVTFDGFHVIQLANQAVDQVRRREVAWMPSLKGTRWSWLKDQTALTEKRIEAGPRHVP